MHNARPLFPANAGQIIPGMGQKRIHQRAILIAGRGMHDQPRGFVEYDQVRILMQYGQGNILRLGQGRDGGRDIERVKRAGANGLGGFAERLSIPAGMARNNQGLDAGAGERTYRLGKEAIGAHAGRFRGRAEFVAFGVQKGVSVRFLKALVIGMGVLIVAATVTLVVLIVQRAGGSTVAFSAATLGQPAGTRIAGIAGVEKTIAIWVVRPDGERVLLFDPARGRVVGEIRAGE